MKRSHILAILFAVFSLQAIADSQEPAYWMKKYPEASKTQVQVCLHEADTAYEKNLKGGMDGVFWAVLHKGNAWEACMDSKAKK